jgi:ATP-dependent exoDNAse (exonuclease V) alpha subunit
MVADWVYHDAPGNPHVHLMTTLRPLTEDGFGAKKVAVTGPDGKPLRNDAGKIVYELWAGGGRLQRVSRRLVRLPEPASGACRSRHPHRWPILRKAGHRPRPHHPSRRRRQGDRAEGRAELGSRLGRSNGSSCRKSAARERRRIQRNPDLVLDLITREKSVFDERDVAKILHRYVDDAGLFQSLMARILQSPETLRLDRERIDFTTGVRAPAKVHDARTDPAEAEMANRSIWLSQRSSHGVRQKVLRRRSRVMTACRMSRKRPSSMSPAASGSPP